MNSQFYILFQHITIAYSIIYSHTKTLIKKNPASKQFL